MTWLYGKVSRAIMIVIFRAEELKYRWPVANQFDLSIFSLLIAFVVYIQGLRLKGRPDLEYDSGLNQHDVMVQRSLSNSRNSFIHFVWLAFLS